MAITEFACNPQTIVVMLDATAFRYQPGCSFVGSTGIVKKAILNILSQFCIYRFHHPTVSDDQKWPALTANLVFPVVP